MNILVTSYYFFPETTPRAFRAYELVKEFLRCGHSVTLIIPKKEIFVTIPFINKKLRTVYVNGGSANEIQFNLEHVYSIKDQSSHNKRGILFNIAKIILPPETKIIIKKFLERKVEYFKPLKHKVFRQNLKMELRKVNVNFDLFISIALPIETHLAAASAMLYNKILKNIPVKVADYGDPFSRRYEPIFFLYCFIDLFIARSFDYISVPTSIAIKTYETFMHKSKIKVFPQGINKNDYTLQPYSRNEIVTFAYAGVFYEKLRNPELLFDFLVSLKKDYRFIIYTIKGSWVTHNILMKYIPLFGERLIIKYNVERKKLVYELSGVDFLINFLLPSKSQTPSKLIDYALSNRPILNVSTTNFDPLLFYDFYNGRYFNDYKVDINQFEIQKIAKSITDLCK